jgi:DNA polymerase III psi subunit
MALSNRQLSVLNTMGIPVWELRNSEPSSDESQEHEVLSDELIARLQFSTCWVLHEPLENEQQTRLFQAMLFSIGLEQNNITMIKPSQLSAALMLEHAGKVLLNLASHYDNSIEHKLEQTVDLLSVFNSYSLNSLLEKPELKAQAWSTLKQLKQLLP